MKVTTFGTRGSVPVAGPQCRQYGGNTTCLQVESDCLPAGMVLVVDGGSGFIPLTNKVLPGLMSMEDDKKEVVMLLTHYHHDHTQGLFLSSLSFVKSIRKTLIGGSENGFGPKKMMEEMMKPPLFPVSFRSVASSFNFKETEAPETVVLAVHPQGGLKQFNLDEYERLVDQAKHLPFNKGKGFPVKECLVITMLRSNHPERTISYRFEERTTGKVFVILTDHENTAENPASLKRHLKGADLVIMDCQYTEEKYRTFTAGFGHATPSYCVRTALEANIKKLGLTHHDPMSSDEQVDAILEEARQHASGTDLEVVACEDLAEYIV